MKKETMFKAMGEVNPEFLSEFEEMASNPVTKKNKNMPIVVMACATLLMGAGTGVSHLNAGGTVDHVKGVAVYTNTLGNVFYENNNELYYVLNGNEINITTFSSEESYFLSVELDEVGTGTVVAVGGETGNRGFTLWEMQEGEVIFVRGNGEQYLSVSDQNGEESLYPQLPWNHHATDFVNENLSKLVNHERLECETVTEVGENSYFVEFNNLDEYTSTEASRFVTHEMISRLSWLSSISVTEDEDVLSVVLYHEETEELYAEASSVLESTGFDYELVFEAE